ncbi:MAG TPA: lysine 5,6-aminomutase subunit alpha [Candidatus Izemoplasmatales bacterium]|nr:lysine 5,6-aminomutase subunit alpha [Candidatus Izemoplasmatales bacterium]
MNKLNLNPSVIADCRRLAGQIADDVQSFINRHTTVTIERTVLRLLGIDGVDAFGVPVCNLMVDEIKASGRLGLGIAPYLASALKASKGSLQTFVTDYLEDRVCLKDHRPLSSAETTEILRPYLDRTFALIRENRGKRNEYLRRFPAKPTEIYVIVATGNIHEDVIQATAAAKAGADIIAVIRTTAQSLLDYVPHGLTTEGFGGTVATQANFRLMRAALDKVSETEKRYIKLVNYASGLCMPEIAAMGALERLDVLLNDSMYGIIFRDINMQRTLVDQYFSRLINAYSGIIINTGEDNYLTTSDAVERAHTVLASQFINEQFALRARLPERLMGLGHAFEIDPSIEDGFLYELAQAQMAREIFPSAPLKYMPPTKHVTGNIFRAYEQNTLFNVVTQMTGQSIHLLGMMTEAIHTPFMQDRFLAVQNMKMVQTTMKSIADEIDFRPDGIIVNRARFVLDSAHDLLASIREQGLFSALEAGVFADIKRFFDGGKGRDGVFPREEGYCNPALRRLEEDPHVD